MPLSHEQLNQLALISELTTRNDQAKRLAKEMAENITQRTEPVIIQMELVSEAAWRIILRNADHIKATGASSERERLLECLYDWKEKERKGNGLLFLAALFLGELKENIAMSQIQQSVSEQTQQNTLFRENQLDSALFVKYAEKALAQQNDSVNQASFLYLFKEQIKQLQNSLATFGEGEGSEVSFGMALFVYRVLCQLQNNFPKEIKGLLAGVYRLLQDKIPTEEIFPKLNALLILRFINGIIMNDPSLQPPLKVQITKLFQLIGNGEKAYQKPSGPSSQTKREFIDMGLGLFIVSNLIPMQDFLMGGTSEFVAPDRDSIRQLYQALPRKLQESLKPRNNPPQSHDREDADFASKTADESVLLIQDSITPRRRPFLRAVMGTFGTALVLGAGATLWPFAFGATFATWTSLWVPVLSVVGLSGVLGIAGGLLLAAIVAGVMVGYLAHRTNQKEAKLETPPGSPHPFSQEESSGANPTVHQRRITSAPGVVPLVGGVPFVGGVVLSSASAGASNDPIPSSTLSH